MEQIDRKMTDGLARPKIKLQPENSEEKPRLELEQHWVHIAEPGDSDETLLLTGKMQQPYCFLHLREITSNL